MNIIGIYKLVDLIFKKLKLEAWEYDKYYNTIVALVYLGLITSDYSAKTKNGTVEVCTTEMYTLNVGGEVYVSMDANSLKEEALAMYIKFGTEKITVTVMHDFNQRRFRIALGKDSDILALHNKYVSVFNSRIWRG